MDRRAIGLVLPSVVLLAFVTAPVGDASGREESVASPARASHVASVDEQPKGRYKQQGDNCLWDANDGGPDQCTPQVKGRFKKGANDVCTWDANDVGSDQCRPPKGRWKRGGDNSCAWDAEDSGADQCNPRRASRR